MYGYRFFLKRLHIIIVLEPQLLHLSIEKNKNYYSLLKNQMIVNTLLLLFFLPFTTLS